MITEDYCSYEVAKLLKEKGFNERSGASYDSKGQLQEGRAYWNKTPIWYAAPTHQMAMKWLREEKNVIIVVQPEYFNAESKCSAWSCDIWADDNYERLQGDFPSYEETIEAALKYSLENLI